MLINIVSILLGIVAFAYKGINFKTREKIMDIGLIQSTHETKKILTV